MHSVSYAIRRDGPKLLTINYDEGYQNLHLLLKGTEIAAIQTLQPHTLTEVRLPDGTQLGLMVKRSWIVGMDLHVSRDGLPLPGSPGDKVPLIDAAAIATFVLAGLSGVGSALSFAVSPRRTPDQDLTWTILLIVALFLATMAFLIWRKKRTALLCAIVVHIAAIVTFPVGIGIHAWNVGQFGGIIVMVLLVLLWLQIRGFRGFASWRREQEAFRQLKAHTVAAKAWQAAASNVIKPIQPLPSMLVAPALPATPPPLSQQSFPAPATTGPYTSFEQYSLRRDEPKRLTVQYSKGYTSFRVLLDGQVVVAYADHYELAAPMTLPDGSKLTIAIVNSGWSGKSRLLVRLNDCPLPGSPDDHSGQHAPAAVAVACVSAYWMVGPLSALWNNRVLSDAEQFVAVFSVIVSIMLSGLAILTWFKSRVALAIAFAFFGISWLFTICAAISGNKSWLEILLAAVLLLLMYRGFQGIESAKLQEHLHAYVSSPLQLPSMSGWIPRHPAQMSDMQQPNPKDTFS